jgi:ribonuclease Z
MTIKLTFLGTSGAVPTAKRNHTGILLTYENENILVDCGENMQRQFRKARLNPGKITRILITHWHGDHVLGIPGILQTLAFSEYNKTLHIYGPKGTKKYMKKMLQAFVFANKINLELHEIEKEGIFLDEKDFYIEAKKMIHGTIVFSYKFVKRGKTKIDKDKLLKSKLPRGPILKSFKEGKDIVYEGKKYRAKDFIYATNELKISFVFDTAMNPKIVPFVKDSDVLVSEATFLSDSEKGNFYAADRRHLTARQAAEIAKKAKVGKLILTHISQRYDKNQEVILKEAKKFFKNSYLINDLDVVKI